jgi:hypothetical protein
VPADATPCVEGVDRGLERGHVVLQREDW